LKIFRSFVYLIKPEQKAMNQKTILSIKQPCSQKFDNFLPTEKGGFCNSCQKEVIDFRNWTDNEVANHFKNTTQKTCGYFREEQLRTYKTSTLQTKKYKYFNVSFLSVSLLSLFSFTTVFGQTKEKPTTIQTQNKNNKAKEVDQQSEGIIVKGVVSDELGPLAGANVALKNSNIGITTNFEGEFTFPKPLSVGDILLVSYIGFEIQEIKVTSETNSIILKMDDSLRHELYMIGEVSVAKVYKSKPSFLKKVKSWFRKNE